MIPRAELHRAQPNPLVFQLDGHEPFLPVSRDLPGDGSDWGCQALLGLSHVPHHSPAQGRAPLWVRKVRKRGLFAAAEIRAAWRPPRGEVSKVSRLWGYRTHTGTEGGELLSEAGAPPPPQKAKGDGTEAGRAVPVPSRGPQAQGAPRSADTSTALCSR